MQRHTPRRTPVSQKAGLQARSQDPQFALAQVKTVLTSLPAAELDAIIRECRPSFRRTSELCHKILDAGSASAAG